MALDHEPQVSLNVCVCVVRLFLDVLCDAVLESRCARGQRVNEEKKKKEEVRRWGVRV